MLDGVPGIAPVRAHSIVAVGNNVSHHPTKEHIPIAAQSGGADSVPTSRSSS
jgi:hypothetical protein